LCDLLWADPLDDFCPEDSDILFQNNRVRGCSFNYSYNAVAQFLERNKLLSVVRAHEAQDAGYRMYKKSEKTGFPSVITLFSAPNYLDHYGNKGAVLRYENNVINIRQFNASPHPYWLPGFMNVFKWSLPFVAEKAGELVVNVVNLVDDEEATKEEEAEKKQKEERDRRRDQIRNKVITLSRLLNLYRKTREEREQVLALGPIVHKGEVVPEAVKHEVTIKKTSLSHSLKAGFASIKTMDRPNEARPEGFEKTEQELKEYHDSLQYQRRKSSRELSLSKKTQDELKSIRLAKEKENSIVPKMIEPTINN